MISLYARGIQDTYGKCKTLLYDYWTRLWRKWTTTHSQHHSWLECRCILNLLQDRTKTEDRTKTGRMVAINVTDAIDNASKSNWDLTSIGWVNRLHDVRKDRRCNTTDCTTWIIYLFFFLLKDMYHDCNMCIIIMTAINYHHFVFVSLLLLYLFRIFIFILSVQ